MPKGEKPLFEGENVEERVGPETPPSTETAEAIAETAHREADRETTRAEKMADAGVTKTEAAGGTPEEIGEAENEGKALIEGVTTAVENLRNEAERITNGEKGKETPSQKEGRGRTPAQADGRVKRWFAEKYETSRLAHTADRIRVWYRNRVYESYAKPATEFKTKLATQQQEIAALEQKRNQYAARLESLRWHRKELGGAFDPKRETQAEEERAKLDREIEKKKAEADKVQSRLETLNSFKDVWENKVKDAATEAAERIDKRLTPKEQQVAELEKHAEQLGVEIENFSERQATLTKTLEELQKAHGEATFEFEKDELKTMMREVQTRIERVHAHVADRKKKQDGLRESIATRDAKLNPWRDKKAKFARITQRTGVATEAPPRKEEDVSRERKPIRGTPRKPVETAPETKNEADKTPPETSEESEEEQKHALETLVNAWNSHFGSELYIKEEKFTVLTALDPETSLDVDLFSLYLKSYLRSLSKEKRLPRGKLEVDIAMLNNIVEGT